MSCKKDCKPRHSPFLSTSWSSSHLVECQDVLITHAWIIPCGSCNELYEWIPSHMYHFICLVRSYYRKTKQTPFPSTSWSSWHWIECRNVLITHAWILCGCSNEVYEWIPSHTGITWHVFCLEWPSTHQCTIQKLPFWDFMDGDETVSRGVSLPGQ
jgi:hypothetical protein